MSALATLALKSALSASLNPAVTVPGVGDVPVRFDKRRHDEAVTTWARVGTVIESRSVTGAECVAQIDVFTTDADGADAYRAGDFIVQRLTADGALAPVEGFAFPWVRADPIFDLTEDGPNGGDVLHVILQFRVRCQSLALAPGRF